VVVPSSSPSYSSTWVQRIARLSKQIKNQAITSWRHWMNLRRRLWKNSWRAPAKSGEHQIMQRWLALMQAWWPIVVKMAVIEGMILRLLWKNVLLRSASAIICYAGSVASDSRRLWYWSSKVLKKIRISLFSIFNRISIQFRIMNLNVLTASLMFKSSWMRLCWLETFLSLITHESQTKTSHNNWKQAWVAQWPILWFPITQQTTMASV